MKIRNISILFSCLALALVGCASVKRASGPIQINPEGALPLINTKEIQIEVIYNGPDEITPEHLRENIYRHRKQVIATQFRNDLEEIGFIIVKHSDTKFKLIVADKSGLSLWDAFYSGLTLTILPMYHKDKIVTEFIIESDNNSIHRTFESSIDIAERHCNLYYCTNKHGRGELDDPVWPEERLAIKDSIAKFIDQLRDRRQIP